MAISNYLKTTVPESDGDDIKVPTYNEAVYEHDTGLGGMLTLDISGTGESDLSKPQALNPRIKFIGTLTGARTIRLPVSLGVLRNHVVENATTGAFSLTIKTTTVGSGGATITQGTKSLISHDGTDVTTIISGGAGSGDALVSNPLSQFAATSSAQLAGVLTDETGFSSGALAVFNNSPAINTPTITTPTIANFSSANHNHSNAAGGGQLSATNAFSTGTVPTARLGSGTANSSTFLRGDQQWATPGGAGNVSGPASSTDNAVTRFDSTSGTLVQNSGVTIDDSDNVIVPGAITGGGTVAGEIALRELTANGTNSIGWLAPDSITATLKLKFPNANPTAGQVMTFGAPVANVSTGSWASAAGTGDVVGPASSTDNALARFDSTTGKLLQNSAVTVADTTGNIVTPGSVTSGLAGTASGDLALAGTTSGTAHLAAPAVAGTGTFNLPVTAGGTFSLGFLDVPTFSHSSAYTFVIEDRGTLALHPSTDTTARTWTIPANSSVAFPVGSAISIYNDTSAGVISLVITTDTLVLVGTGSTGSRSIAANGFATIVKISATRWIINGVNIS